jgi:O-antigen/teichoic acid export membrane protein
VTAPELVLVLLGPSWLPAAPLVAIFSLTAILLYIRQFVIVAITALGRPGHSTRISAQGLGLGLAGLAAGASFGLPVAAAASALRALPLYVPGAALLRRASGMGALDQLRPVARPLLATALMALLVLAVRYALIAAELSPPAVLAGCVAAGAIAYALAVALLARAPLALLLGSAGFRRRRIATQPAEGAGLT